MCPGSSDDSDTFDLLCFLLLASCSCDIWSITRVSNHRIWGSVLWPGGGVAYGTNVLHSIAPPGFNAGSSHSRSRQENMLFLNFETHKTITVCFPTTMHKNSWNKNKILSLPLTQSLRDAINPAVIPSPEIKISVVGFYFLLLETWDSNTWFGAADIWQHRSYLL